MGVATYSYRFSAAGNFTGLVDLTITAATPATNSIGFGPGLAVTSVAGDIGAAPVTGEVGPGGAIATDATLVKTFDNTVFLANNDGYQGSEDGFDAHGIEFAVGGIHYNISYLSGLGGLYLLGDNATGGFTGSTLTLTSMRVDVEAAASPQIHSNDLTYAPSATGSNHFINSTNFEASFPDLINAFGTNQQSMQAWLQQSEPAEQRVATFNGLDYVASYKDLIQAFDTPGATQATLQNAGATHYITYGLDEDRTTTFNALDYVASNPDLVKAFGNNADEGALHFIQYGEAEGRTTSFDGLDYIASYKDLTSAFGANEQAGANHFITFGSEEGRTTTFDGLSYIAGYTDLMQAFGANNDLGAAHYINFGQNEGRTTAFNVQAYEAAHTDLQGVYATNDQFLTAYINTYAQTGHFLT